MPAKLQPSSVNSCNVPAISACSLKYTRTSAMDDIVAVLSADESGNDLARLIRAEPGSWPSRGTSTSHSGGSWSRRFPQVCVATPLQSVVGGLSI